MEQLIQTLVERLIEQTVRAVKAEDTISDYCDKLADSEVKMHAVEEKYAQLQSEYSTTEGAWQYRGEKINELKAENDALKKEVEQLKAKLNSFEGLEEADRGVL